VTSHPQISQHHDIAVANDDVKLLLAEAEADGVLINVVGKGITFSATRRRSYWFDRLMPHKAAIRQLLLEGEDQPKLPSTPPVSSVTSADWFRIIPLAELIERYPTPREPVVEGLLRRGETMNVIAAPKIGKTWLLYGLASAISVGGDWLGFPVEKGRCLIIDAELHPENLSERWQRVLELGGDPSMIDIVPIRGQSADILRIVGEAKRAIESNRYALIVLDALYRLLPAGTSESDNAAMMHVYNSVDAMAASTGAAVAIVHHSTKGDQSGKGVTDVGSGAGSISRAADTHVIIREHAIENCAVLEAVTRSWRPPAPITIRWNYPRWESTMIEPEIKRPKGNQQENQEKRDGESDDAVLSAIKASKVKLTNGQLRTRTGFGPDRVNRTLNRLEKAGTLAKVVFKNKNTGKRREVWEIVKADQF